jgi:alkaline phosphatase D
MKKGWRARHRFAFASGFMFTALAARGAVMTHGPVVGGVTHQSARVFARTDGGSQISIQYSVNPSLSGASSAGPEGASAATDFTAIVPVSGLMAGTRYYYTVLVDGQNQMPPPYPSFQTLPAPGQDVGFNVIVLGDTGNQDTGEPHGNGEAFRSAGNENGLFMLQVGDFPHENPKTVDEKRTVRKTMYDWVRSADFVALTRKMPFFYAWDDHDFGANNSNGHAGFKAYSVQVYKEYVPANLVNPEAGIWQKFQAGQAEFFLMDDRTQRSRDNDPDGPDKSQLDTFRIPNGQKQWLKDSLRASTAVWKIIVSPSVWNPTLTKDDSWFSFRTEQKELLDFFDANKIQNVVMLSGDVHWGAIDDGTHGGVTQMVMPNTNMTFHRQGRYDSIWSHGTWGIPDEDGIKNGYGKLTFQTQPDRLLLEVKSEKGVTQLQLQLTAESPPACVPGPTALCLNGGRFKVTTQWIARDGQSGSGQAVALTGDTGYFTFFSPSNVELVIKVLNGCSVNARYWTFAGGLTDVSVIVTVTDTQTGTIKTYTNPQGTPFQPIQDTSAFTSCP